MIPNLRHARLQTTLGKMFDLRGVVLNSLSSLFLRLSGLLSSFLLGIILARSLGPDGYGIYGLVTAIAALATQAALLGTPQLAVRELAVRSARGDWSAVKSLIRTFGRATTLASLVLTIIVSAGAYLLTSGDGAILRYVLIGAGISALATTTALAASELRGLGAMLKGQFMDIFARPTAAILLCGTVLLAGLPFDASVALLIQLFVVIFAAAVSLFWIRQAIAANSEPTLTKLETGWLRESVPLGFVDVLRQIDGTYSMVLMGWLASASDLGIFRVALASCVLANMPVTILHIVYAPTVSKLFKFGERDQLQRLLRQSSAAMVVVLLPILLILLLVGQPLIKLLFGAAYGDAWLPLALLCAAQLALGLFGMGPILLAMCDSERHLSLIYLVAIGCGVAVALPLIWQFGAIGAAAAQIVSTGLTGYLSSRFARRQLGLGTTFLTRGLSKPREAIGVPSASSTAA